MSEGNANELVTIIDKRRIDPISGEVRQTISNSKPLNLNIDKKPSQSKIEATNEIDDLKSTLKRVKAEYDNYRKRALRDQQTTADRAKANVITQLLDIIDDIELARSHGDLTSGPIKSIIDKLLSSLEDQGLSGFGESNDPFDPILHEAVQHEGEGVDPIVGAVMRRGYKLDNQVIRHALVSVIDTKSAINSNS